MRLLYLMFHINPFAVIYGCVVKIFCGSVNVSVVAFIEVC